MAHIRNGKYVLDYFPEEVINLQKELANHPVLVELLQKHPANEFEVRLAEIASYCEVVLDGIYAINDITNICRICTERLIKKRGGLLLLPGTTALN